MRILESGHYYAAKGPTIYSKIGWEILERSKLPSDQSLLFIDDTHSSEDAPKEELELPMIVFNPTADFVVNESAMNDWGLRFLDILRALPKRQRARKNNSSESWFCSGQRLTDDKGKPLCLLLDAGLTLYKRSLCFPQAVNILPYFYKEEQLILMRLVAKAMPDFKLTVMLFNLDGKVYELVD